MSHASKVKGACETIREAMRLHKKAFGSNPGWYTHERDLSAVEKAAERYDELNLAIKEKGE